MGEDENSTNVVESSESVRSPVHIQGDWKSDCALDGYSGLEYRVFGEQSL